MGSKNLYIFQLESLYLSMNLKRQIKKKTNLSKFIKKKKKET